jgi:aryl-alcohol dehydrogenase (NADP+)
MDYINLGSTGLKVSRLCLGTMTYGSKQWQEWVLEELVSFRGVRGYEGSWLATA